MKVLLVAPPSGGTFRKLGFQMPPLGILYVAAATRAAGHEVSVLDMSVDASKPDFRSFDVVGVHSDTTRFPKAMAIASAAKSAGARVVMGGPHPAFVAAEILPTGHVDAIVRGEGERAFPALLEAWSEGIDPAGVRGLVLPGHDGATDTGEPDRILDLDSLPLPARDLVDLSRYSGARMHGRTITPVHTSRGCPGRCRFCSSTRFDGARWRARSASSVLDEVEHLVRGLGFGAIAFMDDNFTRSPARVREICEGILERKLDFWWWCFSRVDTMARHPELAPLMAKAGARSMFVGVESVSAKTLETFGKGIAVNQARDAIRILRAEGIEVLASFILGAPEEDRPDIRATIRFARELDPDTAQFTLLTPYPGTEIYEELAPAIDVRDWSKYDSMHSVFRHPKIPRTELQLWLGRAYLSFYLRSRESVHGLYRFLRNRRFIPLAPGR